MLYGMTGVRDNSLKYTDPNGQLRVSLVSEGPNLVWTFEDSKPGVPDGDFKRLFDRLYRAEWSRNRATGGAG